MKVGGKKGGVGSTGFVKKSSGPAPGQAGQVQNGAKPNEGDSVDLSSRAKDVSRVKGMLGQVPDVRGELVVKLKTEVDSGEYQVDSGKVAEKMIERAVRDAIYQKKKE